MTSKEKEQLKPGDRVRDEDGEYVVFIADAHGVEAGRRNTLGAGIPSIQIARIDDPREWEMVR